MKIKIYSYLKRNIKTKLLNFIKKFNLKIIIIIINKNY